MGGPKAHEELPRKIPPKFLALKAIPLSDGRIAKFSMSLSPKKSDRRISSKILAKCLSEARAITALELKGPRPAPPGGGAPRGARAELKISRPGPPL